MPRRFVLSTGPLLFLLPWVLAQDALPPDLAQRKDALLKTFAGEFVRLTPGQGKFPASFTMGTEKGGHDSERPARKVTFNYSFEIAKYEVVQDLYHVVMGNNPSKWKGPRNAVELTTWQDAQEFCKKVGAQLRMLKLLAEDEEIRLPSEAEWEYACRAGTNTAYSFGDDLKTIDDYCWYKGNSKGHDPPVGKKKGNPWDLYDMHGYNWEWVADAWQPTYKDAPTDGSARQEKDAEKRVIRGGSWADPADASRSAFRAGHAATGKTDTIGFRVVRAKKK
jgi:formylglycine-generating enzyme required for sulfatase activity